MKPFMHDPIKGHRRRRNGRLGELVEKISRHGGWGLGIGGWGISEQLPKAHVPMLSNVLRWAKGGLIWPGCRGFSWTF